MAIEYDHSGHKAFSYARELVSGDIISSEEVLWPIVKVNDPIKCGTCFHQFSQDELRPPYLSRHVEPDPPAEALCPYALYARGLYDTTYKYLACTLPENHSGSHSLGEPRT